MAAEAAQARRTMSNEMPFEPLGFVLPPLSLHSPVRERSFAGERTRHARRRVNILSVDRGAVGGATVGESRKRPYESLQKALWDLGGSEGVWVDYNFNIINGTSTEGQPSAKLPPIILHQDLKPESKVLVNSSILLALEPSIAHRDLKSHNILVNICEPLKSEVPNSSQVLPAYTSLMARPIFADLPLTQENYVAKLADFGFAKCRSQSLLYATTLMDGTSRWRAPEVFNNRTASVEAHRGLNADIGDSKFHSQSWKKSRAMGSSKHFGVRFRPDLHKWVAEIRVAEWKTVDKKVWLGTFDSEEGAARAVDSARKLLKCKNMRPFNFPCDDLNAYSEEIPPNLKNNLTNISTFRKIADFVKRKAQEYAASFCPNKTSNIAITSDQVLAPDKSLEPSDEKGELVKLLDNAYLKAVEADLIGGESMYPTLQPDRNGWRLNVPENVEDEELNNGSSATDESEAEVTADSPCLETNSNYANYAGRKRKSVDDDDLVTKLAPFIKQQIEDALTSTLLPLVSVLRSREEDEQKHREALLALEEEKLALKREKLLFKRRRVSHSQPNLRASCSPRLRYKSKQRQGLRVKSSAL